MRTLGIRKMRGISRMADWCLCILVDIRPPVHNPHQNARWALFPLLWNPELSPSARAWQHTAHDWSRRVISRMSWPVLSTLKIKRYFFFLSSHLCRSATFFATGVVTGAVGEGKHIGWVLIVAESADSLSRPRQRARVWLTESLRRTTPI